MRGGSPCRGGASLRGVSLLGGASFRGVSLLGGCLLAGRCLLLGGLLAGGAYFWGVSLPGGASCQGASFWGGGLLARGRGSPCWRVSLPVGASFWGLLASGCLLLGGLLARRVTLRGVLLPRGCLPLGEVVFLLGGASFWGGLLAGGSPCWRGLLTRGCLLPEGVPPSRGVSLQGDPPLDTITDTSKNITLATTSLRPVLIIKSV